MNYEIIKLNDNTWRIENGFVRLFLITGTEKALLIDTGASLPNAREIAESLTDLPITLVYTHGDGDHTSGTAAFAEFMMHPEDHVRCGTAARYPDSKLIPVSDGDIIELGDRRIELIHIPGHTYGSVAILDTVGRALYAGDSVQDGHVFMQGAHRNPPAYAASLAKLIAREAEYDVVYGFHGSPELPASYVRTVAAAWDKVCAGEVEPKPFDMRGNTVLSYDCEGCGFYCNAK